MSCRACQHRFGERKGSALYRFESTDDKAFFVFHRLQESCGVRQTGRLAGVNKKRLFEEEENPKEMAK